MNTGSIEEFDGISLIEWTEDNKIKSLKEYGCNLNNYNPYQHSDNPQFRDEKNKLVLKLNQIISLYTKQLVLGLTAFLTKDTA